MPASVQSLSDEFSAFIQERHDKGAKEYGDLTFLEVNTVQYLVEELADLCNYARYVYIKFRLLEEMLRERGLDLSAGLSATLGNGDSVSSNPTAFVPSEALQGFLPFES